jgi:hypothetical protein
MEATNLVFAIIIIAILSTGYGVLVVEVAKPYPVVGSQLQFVSGMNNSLNEISGNTTAMFDMAKKTSTDNLLGMALGLLGTGFQAVVMIAYTPTVLMSTVGSMLLSSGGIIPAWFLSGLLVAVSFSVVLGLLFYIFKVK